MHAALRNRVMAAQRREFSTRIDRGFLFFERRLMFNGAKKSTVRRLLKKLNPTLYLILIVILREFENLRDRIK